MGLEIGPGILQVSSDMAVGQNPWYHVEVGAPPILIHFSGDWDVHSGYHMVVPATLTVPFAFIARPATIRRLFLVL